MVKIQSFLSARPDKPIYHYASSSAAISIIRDKKLWASSITHLNDSAEYFHAVEWLSDELKKRDSGRQARSISRALQNASLYGTERHPLDAELQDESGRWVFEFVRSRRAVFVASFTEEANLLSQWRAYCPMGDGYSLGFDATNYPKAGRGAMHLVRCVYTEAEKEDLLNSLIESWDDRDAMAVDYGLLTLTDTMAVMAAVKHESFKEEKEWRLVGLGSETTTLYRPGRHGIVPYKELTLDGEGSLQLKNVCVGPNSDQDAAVAAVTTLVKQYHTNEVAVDRSYIPFRR